VGGAGEPYLIPPREEILLTTRQGRQPVALPPIICTARYESLTPARNPAEDYSLLILIWFQDKYALPIDKVILDCISILDWDAVAIDEVL
jgi:hypothetical protein